MVRKLNFLLLSVVITILLASCEKDVVYKDGKVEMDRLVTLNEIWENKDKYLGKVVTLKIQVPVFTYGTTSRDLTHGDKLSGRECIIDGDKPYHVDIEATSQTQSETSGYVQNTRENDSALQYHLKPNTKKSLFSLLVLYHTKERAVKIPDWISEVRKPIIIYKEKAEWELTLFPGTKYLTGICQTIQIGDPYLKQPTKLIALIPTGLKVKGNKNLWVKDNN